MTRHSVFSVPASLPESKRRTALDLQVRKSFPFKEPAFAAFWQGTDATVYAWDDGPVRARLQEAGLPSNTQVVPESFIRPRGDGGVRLVTMLDGFEGQFWIDGFLRASRWWPTAPTAAEWSRFMRSVGLAASETNAAPTALDLAFAERPWTEGTFSLDDWSTLLQSRRVLTIAATTALCPFVFLGAQWAVLAAAETGVRSELAGLDAASRSIRQERGEAYRNLEAIEDFTKLDVYPAQAEVLATAMTLLTNTGGPRIVSWSFDRGNLEIVARSDHDLDPTAYIKLFESDDAFENVSGTFVGQERDLQLRMSVVKRAAN